MKAAEVVLRQLAEIREGGETNMLDTHRVMVIAMREGKGELAKWIAENIVGARQEEASKQWAEVLELMAEWEKSQDDQH